MKSILFVPPSWTAAILRSLDASRFRATIGALNNIAVELSAFDCVVPTGLVAYRKLQQLEQEGLTNVLIPDARIVAILDDKLRFSRFCGRKGYGRFIPALISEPCDYPFIYKKRIDAWGMHSRVIHSGAQLAAFEAGIDTQDYFKQAYVAGPREYTTHVLALRGQVVFERTFEFVFESDYFVKGKLCKHRSMAAVDTPFRDFFANFVADIDYSGTCCFNYKIQDGVPKIFEVNPRFGASLTFVINDYLEALLGVLEFGRRSISMGVKNLPKPQPEFSVDVGH